MKVDLTLQNCVFKLYVYVHYAYTFYEYEVRKYIWYIKGKRVNECA